MYVLLMRYCTCYAVITVVAGQSLTGLAGASPDNHQTLCSLNAIMCNFRHGSRNEATVGCKCACRSRAAIACHNIKITLV